MRDLLGERIDRVKAFGQKYPTPRKVFHVEPPAPVLTIPEAQADRIRQTRARHFQQWALEELDRWRGRIPEAEWQRQRAKLEQAKGTV